MQRILLIANKNWEAEPILNALLNKKFRPENLNNPSLVNYPLYTKQGEPFPRAVWKLENFQFELWCIENIMAPNPDASNKEYYSSSEQKNIDLEKVFHFSQDEVALVVAIGTAGYSSEVSKNGSVIIGSNIFIYDGHPNDDNPVSKWHNQNYFGKLIESVISDKIVNKLQEQLSIEITKLYFQKRLLSVPLNTMEQPQIIFGKELVALSNVNVTNYTEYKIKDLEGLQSFQQTCSGKELGSVETTHGVIRVHAADKPFIFISAIVDRLGYFDTDVAPKEFAQNFSGSFNAGFLFPG